MITEDYVSFETAKLLKEKGFNEPCLICYTYDGKLGNYGQYNSYKNSEVFALTAPTIQMTIKWLREVHNICISVDVKIGGGKYYVCISGTENGLSHDVLEDEVWNTFEEACEESIRYCLENLI